MDKFDNLVGEVITTKEKLKRLMYILKLVKMLSLLSF